VKLIGIDGLEEIGIMENGGILRKLGGDGQGRVE